MHKIEMVSNILKISVYNEDNILYTLIKKENLLFSLQEDLY